MNELIEDPKNILHKKDIFFQSKIQAKILEVLDFWCANNPSELSDIVNMIRGENNKK